MNTVTVNGRAYEVKAGDTIRVTDTSVTIGEDRVVEGGRIDRIVIDSLHLHDVAIESDTQVEIRGTVHGNIQSQGDIVCQDVHGKVTASGSVVCRNVSNNVMAGGNIVASHVSGNAKSSQGDVVVKGD